MNDTMMLLEMEKEKRKKALLVFSSPLFKHWFINF